jgi:hypothetical protein
MVKQITAQTTISFQCHCGNIEPGEPEDTLMYSGTFAGDTDARHAVMIENSPFDHAGQKIMTKCPKCPSRYLTLVRMPPNELGMYTCHCGYRDLVTNYIKNKMALIAPDEAAILDAAVEAPIESQPVDQ